MSIPERFTPDDLAQIASFLAEQRRASQQKPLGGLLPPEHIRGNDPNYRYKYREYPKALTPPAEHIADADAERRFRVKYKDRLPYDGDDAPAKIAEYYALASYPKKMEPPQVIVNTIQEEESVLAGWNAGTPGRKERVTYPRWMFHGSKEPVLVSNINQEQALGRDWYPTVGEAMNSVKEAMVSTRVAEENDERSVLLHELEERGGKADRRWSTDRLRAELDKLDRESVPETESDAA